MRHPASSPFFLSRLAVGAMLSAAVLSASGCGWFRRDAQAYKQSAESRPLEVPPDLDLPNTTGAVAPPAGTQSALRSATSPRPGTQAPAPSGLGFNVAGSRDAVFERVGEALAAMPGVTIASRAQLLGAYDVGYEGSKFLVRISAIEGGTYVSAVDPRGQPAEGAAPTKLIAALQAALSR